MHVTIIVPHYNASTIIARCIASITGQAMSSWQLLVVDDCSHDGSDITIPHVVVQHERDEKGTSLIIGRRARAARTRLNEPANIRHVPFLSPSAGASTPTAVGDEKGTSLIIGRRARAARTQLNEPSNIRHVPFLSPSAGASTPIARASSRPCRPGRHMMENTPTPTLAPAAL